MQKTTKLSLAAIAAAIAIIALIFSSPVATAADSSGKFNPQTQFPVGTTVTFNSLNGVALERVNFTKPRFTYYEATVSITVQIDRFTGDGGVHWKVLSGVFTINGQTYTIIEGDGHMNAQDEIASGMDGQATGLDGMVYQWRLHGLAALYNGVLLVSLGGAWELSRVITRFLATA